MATAFRLRARPAIGEWSAEQVSDLLETLGLDEGMRQLFREEEVDGAVLVELSDADLSGEPFKLTFGHRKTLLAEVRAQHRYAQAKERQRTSQRGCVLPKGAEPEGPRLSTDALERIRNWRLEPSSGRLAPREPPLTDDELACWQYQASWLVCPVTGKAWARSDVLSIMGVALYHAPRFCSEKEKQRLLVEMEQARRSDGVRKAAMDHSGTAFERDYEVYPLVEPPPVSFLPRPPIDDEEAAAGSGADGRLQQLKTEASGLRSRSTRLQRQMFQDLAGDGSADAGGGADAQAQAGFLGDQDVKAALEKLKQEPQGEDELARKFSIYESYFAGVVELRSDLFGLWDRGRGELTADDSSRMSAALRRIDGFENLSIPERCRFWFVYHMMSQASENHAKMQRALDDLEELFETTSDQREAAASGAGALEELSDDPQLGTMEVVIGPAFDIEAYNDGINGNSARGILSSADRGVLDMDRQYNAVNFQVFVQRADAGATRAGAEASYARRLCTSRLSLYIDESHGSRVFPRNVLSQLSLLFYRRNDALRLPGGRVNEQRVAVCIRKAIPRILRAIVVEVFQGDKGYGTFAPRTERAVRVYLAVHQLAIKLLATFRVSFESIYRSVVDWIQQPFCHKSDAQWPDLEELLLGASLCSVPWPLLREAFVRKLFVQLLQCTTQMSGKTPMRQQAEHLFSQNLGLLNRLAYILAFFQAGPGRLPVQEMDAKYARCAGTLPCAEREALVIAAESSGVGSLLELWAVLGMRRQADTEDELVLRHIEQFIAYTRSNEASWRAAVPPMESEGPALPPAALAQLACIGLKSSGGAAAHPDRPLGRQERELEQARRLAAERAQHQGFPVLPASRRLDGNMCYYCHRRFPSRGALFGHLRRLIDRGRFVEGHHQAHFQLRVTGALVAPFRCGAESCGREFSNAGELMEHYHRMGVPGVASAQESAEEPAAGLASVQREECGPPAPGAMLGAPADDAGGDLALCSVCMDKPPSVVMVPCGHVYACQTCGSAMKECAVCRAPVAQVMRIYYS